jgi:hypothetical protein
VVRAWKQATEDRYRYTIDTTDLDRDSGRSLGGENRSLRRARARLNATQKRLKGPNLRAPGDAREPIMDHALRLWLREKPQPLPGFCKAR